MTKREGNKPMNAKEDKHECNSRTNGKPRCSEVTVVTISNQMDEMKNIQIKYRKTIHV